MATESVATTATTTTSPTSNLVVKATTTETTEEINTVADTTSSMAATTTPQTATTPIDSNHRLCQTNTDLSTSSYMSSEEAQEIIIRFCNETISSGYRPRFVPILELLLDAATKTSKLLATLQLGGMDGKTGDPFYKVSQKRKSLQKWIPIVIEPVPTNFDKLVQTYEEHQWRKKLPCPTLLNQLINYGTSNHVSQNACAFCHFDEQSSNTTCHDMPDWKKRQKLVVWNVVDY